MRAITAQCASDLGRGLIFLSFALSLYINLYCIQNFCFKLQSFERMICDVFLTINCDVSFLFRFIYLLFFFLFPFSMIRKLGKIVIFFQVQMLSFITVCIDYIFLGSFLSDRDIELFETINNGVIYLYMRSKIYLFITYSQTGNKVVE